MMSPECGIDCKMQIEQHIKELAVSLNLPLCGIAAPELEPFQFEKFTDWINSGACADMEYLRREPQRRSSIIKVMPDVRSVVVFGLPYYSHIEKPQFTEPAGRISQYATGRDYHRIMESRLKEIIRRVPELSAAKNRIYVDYGPLLERAYAQAAGLGFIGKNNCLINTEWGSFFFIGIIATTLELERDKPQLKDCGRCRACLDACPAAALGEAYRLDARRCLSYHSVENRTEIPFEICESWHGDWIMGCDACQNACPYNRSIPETPEPECGEFKTSQYVPLTDFLLCDEATFLSRFEGSPLRRTGYAGMVRNCAIVAAHSPNRQKALEMLEKALALHMENDLLRKQILWAIGYVRDRIAD